MKVVGDDAVVPFGEVESLDVKGGRITLKKTGIDSARLASRHDM